MESFYLNAALLFCALFALTIPSQAPKSPTYPISFTTISRPSSPCEKTSPRRPIQNFRLIRSHRAPPVRIPTRSPRHRTPPSRRVLHQKRQNDVVFANRPRFLNSKYFGHHYSSIVWAPQGSHWDESEPSIFYHRVV
ncbi:hypothetical protein RJ641_032127 [Dillenia turbinata]|uniref:Uncharacterized protein n=1 Tax=Dillenia turbinata TaxID=194707 RepID=A0AAN8VRC7_9MAGN